MGKGYEKPVVRDIGDVRTAQPAAGVVRLVAGGAVKP